MWYWLMKIEGMFFLPVFMVYYALHGTPFYMRCTRCKRILFDQIYIRLGVCERCLGETVRNEPGKFDEEDDMQPSGHFKSSLEPLYDMIAREVGDGKILDVGCRFGDILHKLEGHGDLFGVDISKMAIEIAKARAKGAELHQSDARTLPFQSDTFDWVICTEMLEHTVGDDVAREIYRVLKPGGVALISVPNGRGPWGKYFPAHIQLFTFKSFVTFLEEVGFEVINGQKLALHIPFVTRFLSALPYALGRDIPIPPLPWIKVPEPLAADFLFKCRKPYTSKIIDYRNINL
jgi:SAM-dependent methyltransferase